MMIKIKLMDDVLVGAEIMLIPLLKWHRGINDR